MKKIAAIAVLTAFGILACTGLALRDRVSPAAQAEEPAATASVTAEPDAPALTPQPTTPPNAQGMPYLLDDHPLAPVTLSEWKGTPTFLNFFTTWCPYCRDEMSVLEELQAAYGENLRVVLVHVPSGEDEATARAYLEKEGLSHMNFVEDNGYFSYMYGITGFPTSVVMDAEGYLSAYFPGAVPEETIRQAVEDAGATLPKEAADAH